MTRRQIVKIDEELCNGCGLCVSPCAEGAISIENGKAKVNNEALCDGAGFCLGVCPQGALSLEYRNAPEFDEAAVEEHQKQDQGTYIAQVCFQCGRDENEVYVLPCRRQGQARWICTKCLPSIIHG